jgi:acyl dehydratase
VQPPAIGDTYSSAVTLTQRDFDEFARLSGDDNPIHVDPEFSARTAFGRTVAHGMMLFGLLEAATTQWLNSPLQTRHQELMFTAPTFTGEAVAIDLAVMGASADGVEIAQRLTRPDGVQTCVGSTRLGIEAAPARETDRALADGGVAFRGLEVGMAAEKTRTFSAGDIAAYAELIDDPNPRYGGTAAVVPPPLLGGLISCLLGVELPGAGTNWLKQRYRFHRAVASGELVTARVEISRLRPDKALVNLCTRCITPHGVAVTGEALVLVADLVSPPRG